MSAGARPSSGRVGVVVTLVALGLLGVLTGLLGSGIHLARVSVLGLLLPHGVLLAVALVVATDVAVATAVVGRRPGPGWALLAVAAGRGVVLGLLLLPTPAGDLVLTGLPASTAWILLSVLLPAFAAPMALAVAAPRRAAGGGRDTGRHPGTRQAMSAAGT